MTVVDVNVLISAKDSESPYYEAANRWLDGMLEGDEVIGLPWAVLVGFVRISTNARALRKPLTIEMALHQVSYWLSLPGVSVVHPTLDHEEQFTRLCRLSNATGNLVTDAHLAALAIEHNCALASYDSDFAKFPDLRWINPLA